MVLSHTFDHRSPITDHQAPSTKGIFFSLNVKSILFFLAILFIPLSVYSQDRFYTILISIHGDENSATQTTSELKQKGYDAFYRYTGASEKEKKFKVYVGKFASKQKAVALLNKLLESNLTENLTLTRLDHLSEPNLSASSSASFLDGTSGKQSDERSISAPHDTVTSLENTLSQALKMYHEEQFAQALPLFNQVLKQAKNSDVMFWAGICAAKTKNYDLAITHFQNLLKKEKNASQIHLQLSAVYLKVGKYQEAHYELVKAKAISPPPDVLKRINQLLVIIDSYIKKITWKLYFSQGGGYDDNISCGPVSNIIDDIPSNLLNKKSSILWLSYLNTEFSYDIGTIKHYFWKGTASLYNSHSFEDDNYNYANLDISSGPFWEDKQRRIKIPFGLTYKRYGRTSLSNTFNISPSAEYFPGTAKTIGLNGCYTIKIENYINQTFKDAGYDNISQALSIGPNIYLKNFPRIISLRMDLEHHGADEKKQSFLSIHFSTSLFSRFSTGTDLFLEYKYTDKNYITVSAFYDTIRNDARHTITFILNQVFFKHYFVATELMYIENQSNRELFEFNKKKFVFKGGVNF